MSPSLAYRLRKASQCGAACLHGSQLSEYTSKTTTLTLGRSSQRWSSVSIPGPRATASELITDDKAMSPHQTAIRDIRRMMRQLRELKVEHILRSCAMSQVWGQGARPRADERLLSIREVAKKRGAF